MRWTVNLDGYHGEGVESRERFEELVAKFRVNLEVNGFVVEEGLSEVDVDGSLAQTRAGDWSLPDFSTDFEAEALAEETSTAVEELSLAEQIVQLRAAREAGETLSQREMSKILGVPRSRIRKALEEMDG